MTDPQRPTMGWSHCGPSSSRCHRTEHTQRQQAASPERAHASWPTRGLHGFVHALRDGLRLHSHFMASRFVLSVLVLQPGTWLGEPLSCCGSLLVSPFGRRAEVGQRGAGLWRRFDSRRRAVGLRGWGGIGRRCGLLPHRRLLQPCHRRTLPGRRRRLFRGARRAWRRLVLLERLGRPLRALGAPFHLFRRSGFGSGFGASRSKDTEQGGAPRERIEHAPESGGGGGTSCADHDRALC